MFGPSLYREREITHCIIEPESMCVVCPVYVTDNACALLYMCIIKHVSYNYKSNMCLIIIIHMCLIIIMHVSNNTCAL